MQAPERIEPRSLADYLEVMSKSVFQTGISWRVGTPSGPASSRPFEGLTL